jgi:hypothetical protein
MKNSVFWDGMLGTMLAVTSKRRTHRAKLQVTANVVPSSSILVALMMEALRSSETSFIKDPQEVNIPGDGIIYGYLRLNCQRKEQLKIMWSGNNLPFPMVQ